MEAPMEQPVDRETAMADLRTIWRLSARLEQSEFHDLAPRAAEIKAMAHYMLYDADAGIEEDR
jgi:hypothetical protein